VAEFITTLDFCFINLRSSLVWYHGYSSVVLQRKPMPRRSFSDLFYLLSADVDGYCCTWSHSVTQTHTHTHTHTRAW